MAYPVDLVLRDALDSLCGGYAGDPVRMALNLRFPEFNAAILESARRQGQYCSRQAFGTHFSGGMHGWLVRYAALIGRQDLARTLRPYHLRRASVNTFLDPAICDEVLLKKFDHLLLPYEGRLERLLPDLTAELMEKPFPDEVCGIVVSVSVKKLKLRCGHMFSMVRRFIELRGLTAEFAAFRPYHMPRVGHGLYDDPKIVDEILEKKIDSLVAATADGRLESLITEPLEELLMSPLWEEIHGQRLAVSTIRTFARFDHNHFHILRRYIELKGREAEFAGLRPYHLVQASKRTYADPAVVDEVIVKKVDQLRGQSELAFETFLAGVNAKDLMTNFSEPIAGGHFEVSVGQAFNLCGRSPHTMLRRYAKAKGIPFPYSKRCFMGDVDQRRRYLSGELTEWDIRQLRDSGGHYDTGSLGFRQYSSSQKDVMRQLIVEEGIETLGDADVSYFGLETEQFVSLRLIAEQMNFRPSLSMVVQRDRRVYNAMHSTACSVYGRLKGTRCACGELVDVVRLLKLRPFNFINLDFDGYLSKSKIEAIEQLFQRGYVAERALFVVTLSNSGMDQCRSRRHTDSTDQVQTLSEVMTNASPGTYRVAGKFDITYSGGLNRKTGKSMLVVGFVVVKVETSRPQKGV
jgi:hypothetical protein